MKELTFSNIRGNSLYSCAYVPENAQRLLIFFHGYAEHTGRYTRFVEELNQADTGVILMDHEGHGKSGGTRCDIKEFSYFVDDGIQLLDEVKKRWPDMPLYIGGHGMGGNVALLIAASEQIREMISGVIVSAPLLDLSSFIPKTIREMARYVASVTPQVPVLKPDLRKLSRNPEVVELYKNDPLIYSFRIRARMAMNLIGSADLVAKKVDEITSPVLFLQGSKDMITHVDETKVFFQNLASTEKTLKIFDGFYHELFLEPDNQQVFDEITHWLQPDEQPVETEFVTDETAI